MKSFWIGALVLLLEVTGFLCLVLVGYLDKNPVRYIFYFVAIPRIILPSIFWWTNYFDKLFKK